MCKPNNFSILLLFLLLGILLTNLNKSSKLISFIDIRNDFKGVVDEVIRTNEEDSKYVVIIEEIDGIVINEKVILTIIGQTKLNLGDEVNINGILKIPARNTNPKMFNYRLNLLSDKIHTTMTIKDYSIQTLNSNISIRYRLKAKFTKDVTDLFQKKLGTENAQMITSIILGKSTHLDEEDLTKYRELGLAHILAVSGLHIGIITGFIIFVFSRIGINRKINVIMSLMIIWIYVYIIGFPPSAVRAALMFSILFYSQLVHEPYDSINTVMFSMLLSLFINPFWLFNVGFQLSYMATISILVLGPKFTKLFYPLKSKLMGTISSIVGVIIGLFPLQAYYFNSVPLLGIISNLITVPLITIALIIGIIMIILNYTFYFLNDIFGFLLDNILSIQYWIVNTLYKIPVSSITIYSPGILEILLFYLAVGIVFGYIRVDEFKLSMKKSIFYYLLIFISLASINVAIDDSIEIDFIDVGQGDSILIKTQDSTYLVDTGGSLLSTFDIGKNITLPYLQKQGIGTLDGLIITHFDEDHSQGLYALMDGIKINAIYVSYSPISELSNKIDSYKIPLIYLKSNHTLTFDRNTRLEVIWPTKNTNLDKLSSNNKSLVSVLTYRNIDTLLTGDIEKEVEYLIADDIPRNIEILKVAHHGSKTSSTVQFIERIRPKYSIISVGKNNFYGHPNGEVIARLSNVNSKIYRSDEMGRIKVSLDENIQIDSFIQSVEEIKLSVFLWKNSGLISFYILYYLISYILVKKYVLEKGCCISEL